MGEVGRGGALDMGSAPARDKLWIRPCKSSSSTTSRIKSKLIHAVICVSRNKR